jgi:hypothetical protein
MAIAAALLWLLVQEWDLYIFMEYSSGTDDSYRYKSLRRKLHRYYDRQHRVYGYGIYAD